MKKQRILVPMALLAVLSACGAMDDAPDASAPDASAPEASAPEASTPEASTPQEESPAATIVATTAGELGTFLVDGDGRTLYLFTVDDPGVSNCAEACLEAWPPLLADGDPTAAGAADAALVGTLTRDDGTLQVTYAGWPLYLFAADTAPGDINGQGVNDVWFVVSPAGERIEMAPDVDGDTEAGGYVY